MDVGNSLNPTLDIGQIEGAFMQGMGWSTLEQLVWFDNGYLFTRGPSTYKIPAFNDIPVDFRVELLADSPNNKVLHSSKGVGEPPFFLGASVFFALRDAITYARKESGLEGFYRLDSPATSEAIRMSCVDSITSHFTTSSVFSANPI